MNVIKKFFVFALICSQSIVLKSQTVDITSCPYTIDSNTVLDADTLRLDVTKNIIVRDFNKSNKRDFLVVLASCLGYDVLSGPKNSNLQPETSWEFFVDDCKFWVYENRIFRKMNRILKGKTIVFYTEEDSKVLSIR